MQCIICGAGGCTCKGATFRPSPYPPVGTMISTQSLGGPVATAKMYTVPRRLCRDKEGNIVEGNDPNRVGLFLAKGAQIPLAQAEALGLVEDDEAKEDKGEAAPTGDKAKTPEATK